MMPPALSNRLVHLAGIISNGHQQIERGAVAMAERALAVGAALAEAKCALPHGELLPWLAAQTNMSGRTARRYMQLASSGVEAATVADLGLRRASVKIARSSVRRPPLGCYAEAVADRETMALVWRDAVHPEFFHVVVMGCIDNQDHSIATTARPCSSERLPRVVAEAGFPVGAAPFQIKPASSSTLRVLEDFRQMGLTDPRPQESSAGVGAQ